jgi:hypothetical protein
MPRRRLRPQPISFAVCKKTEDHWLESKLRSSSFYVPLCILS